MSTSMFIVHLSKIWSEILQGSQNQFVIDTTEKLIYLSGLFSKDLSRQILDVLQRPDLLVFNKNQILRLYIIYFCLVAYPTIDHSEHRWLNAVLNDLHRSFQKYLDKNSIEIHSVETRFYILQHFMKSLITINVENSSLDNEFCRKHFDSVLKCPDGNIF
ncbi:hypothetical protein RF11_10656 [Thelohanellus kitauei]|uniref:Uncharacterized protein n=1 Tax=Thelohanellus kitauei TaxID=669202 RepID=A0A0C2JRN6_THEKT|nr:hypothetical protein RF11_10656 [Thelohanellus kitauei]